MIDQSKKVAFVTELNTNNYKTFTENGLVLVDIKADWCGPCRMISPIIDDISSEFLNKLSVGKLDADESKEIVDELGVRNIPTILIYKNGEIVERNTGSITKQKLVEMINTHLTLS